MNFIQRNLTNELTLCLGSYYGRKRRGGEERKKKGKGREGREGGREMRVCIFFRNVSNIGII